MAAVAAPKDFEPASTSAATEQAWCFAGGRVRVSCRPLSVNCSDPLSPFAACPERDERDHGQAQRSAGAGDAAAGNVGAAFDTPRFSFGIEVSDPGGSCVRGNFTKHPGLLSPRPFLVGSEVFR